MKAGNDGLLRRSWNASWIWGSAQRAEDETNVFRYFRREWTPPRAGGRYVAFVSADTVYELRLNGRRIASGPPRSAPHLQYYDAIGLEGLEDGPNCFGIVVYHIGRNLWSRPGLLFEIVDERGETALASDASWRSLPARAWERDTFFFRMSLHAPYQEMHDAREVPHGWDRVGYSSAAWEPTHILVAGDEDRSETRWITHASSRPPAVTPWVDLVQRDIPFPAERIAFPAEVAFTEETVDIRNRLRPDDLSMLLSVPGQPLAHAAVEGVQQLLGPEGVTTVRAGIEHPEPPFDAVYNPCVILDFGRIVPAHLEIDIEGPAGARVDIGYADRLTNGRFQNLIEGVLADGFTLEEGRHVLRTFHWRGFRYVKLMFRDCLEPLTLHAVRAAVVEYPLEPRARFESGREDLNRLFEVCRATVRACSVEALMDTPWREQAQFVGDAGAVTVELLQTCFGETRLPAKYLRQSAANQLPTGFLTNVTNAFSGSVPGHHDWRRVHPDFSLWWIHALWAHHRYSGDERLLHHHYPHALRIVQAFQRYIGPEGVLRDVPFDVFIDWAHVEKRGESAVLNALFYGVLGLVREMAALRGDAYALDDVEATRDGIAAAFEGRFFDPGRGCFADANLGDGPTEKTSEHANAAAIRWGLADARRSDEIIRNVFERRTIPATEVQPFFGKVLLLALARAGRFDLALRLLEERWIGRILARGGTTTFEEWTVQGSWRSGVFQPIMRSRSHAWAAFPAEFLIRVVPGIEILKPGCTELRVRPNPVPFDYRIAFPTPHGNVSVVYQNGRAEVRTDRALELSSEDASRGLWRAVASG